MEPEERKPSWWRKLSSHFRPGYLETLIYMAQITDYDTVEYWNYLARTKDFTEVMKRGSVDWTRKAKLLYIWMIFGVIMWVCLSLMVWLVAGWWTIALVVVAPLATPWLLQWWLWLVMVAGNLIVQKPVEWRALHRVRKDLMRNKAVKIAVLGSYGKTTTKSVLEEILGEGVKATPGNINQPLGFAKFISELDGTEKVLIFEFGEAKKGDIKRMARLVRPDYAIVTGVAEAHLERFGSLKNIISTFNEIRDFVPKNRLFLNMDNEVLAKQKGIGYSKLGIEGLHVRKVKLGAFETSFEVNKQRVTTGLIGEHNIGVVTLGMYLAEQLLGAKMSKKLIARVAGIKAFEHRLEPKIVHEALLIDDTYNGNLEGVRAGVNVVAALKKRGSFVNPAGEEVKLNRVICVTPGLVEQGTKMGSNNRAVGRLIGEVADAVVLMQNSVTGNIEQGLNDVKWSGELVISDNPLEFYENLTAMLARGDIMLLQNDWTDNYE
ncbi:Mur ligase family protein [Candidatus Saccharibacteria bacterium]|nr:Mur ligase family protein [Candidatus Saccharibacteria bacterium]